MQVPLLDLQAQLEPLREEILAAVTDVIDSTRYIMGPKVESLEGHVAAYCGAKYGIGVSSGTDALLASLMALGVGPGDLVLTTPYTFIATMGCILRLGARPVFADIDPITFNIDPEKMARLLEENPKVASKVKVIMPVHLFGQCVDMGKIIALSERFAIPIVEDAAQAIGACYPLGKDGEIRWLKAGAMGRTGCFSFFPSKNLGGIGDGGMVITDDTRLAEQIRIISIHGGNPKYHHAVIGGNFRLDPLQAVVLDIKLKYLPAWHQARRHNGALYNRLFNESGLIARGLIKIPDAVYKELAERGPAGTDYHIYNQYVIRADRRDDLRAFLQNKRIGVEVYYPIPLHKQKCVADLGFNSLSFPEAEKAAIETLALPIYPELTDDMQQYVVDSINEFYS